MTQSLEDYLEAICFIIQDKKVARVKDIAEFLNVKKPSVINAVKELLARGLVEHEKYGYIELTKKGQKKARIIYEKHIFLTDFFKNILGVSNENAESEACRMEHIFSDESWQKFKSYVEKHKS